MKIHEYQAKALFRERGIPVPRGILARDVDAAASASDELTQQGVETPVRVVKAQVHAGGRGKAGGVKVVKDPGSVRATAEAILGMKLVTPQTGADGVEVRQVLIEEGLDIARELYVAVTLDRAAECPVIMASTEGGTEIEEVAETNPDAILKEWVHPTLGLQDHQCRRLAFGLGLAENRAQLNAAVALFQKLAAMFDELDASLVEVNPLIVTGDGSIVALDGKMNLDDNALFRHPEIAELRDQAEEDPLEVEASKSDLNYIRLDGNIACMVNGAGLAMATMDLIKLVGGEPANFLDVGGGATSERVAEAFKLVLSNKNVSAIMVNIFGGIVRCDLIAEGIISAVKEVGVEVPVVVRLEGTNVKKGRELLKESGLDIIAARDLTDAAEKAVAAAS